jgi:hypothetical protein
MTQGLPFTSSGPRPARYLSVRLGLDVLGADAIEGGENLFVEYRTSVWTDGPDRKLWVSRCA